MSSTIEIAKSMQADLVAMRRELHAHPELNFVEHKTSQFAAEKLIALGFTVRQIGGKTGLVADFGSGSSTIAIRCDMDGLPIAELNRTNYVSQNAGVMHAWGNISCARHPGNTPRVGACRRRAHLRFCRGWDLLEHRAHQ
jgi:metal-dependent amidase/aminoacylase/carboxypeptidase family protein